ncbi:outer membrane protein assembly factor BamB family protein [Cellulomonas fengjieae]|uniref:outer membrane protein assembly factor BamB family protein n=1 Tax=Cellulomonas fengjieae TaxID=2819978 RepID=UPI001AAEB8B1|nr:PQQ-binding-like beta-propeller repeat protein [Cellulomonas fengjieae]MBO3103911.1 PQQ-binding-like beta-propeller repeat protein [Cellulomonas fengjieae]
MGRRGDMRAVELLDATASRAPRRWHRSGLVIGVALLAVMLAGAQLVMDARERAAVAALASVPGVLDPVDADLDVVRRMAPAEMGELYGAGGSIGLGPDGSQRFSWTGPDGGEWTTELLGPSPALSGPNASPLSGCTPDRLPGRTASVARRVVCLVTDGATIRDEAGRTTTVPATARRVVVLSVVDGSIQAQWPVESGHRMALLPGEVVVVGEMTADASTTTAYDLLTGEKRWTYRHPLPPASAAEDNPFGTGLFRAGDLVAIVTPPSSLLLLSAQGKAVREVDLDLEGSGSWMTDPTTGGLILQKRSTARVSQSILIAPDGDPAKDITLDGAVVWPLVDDGSVPGLRLSSDAALHGWDSTGGSELWSHDAPDADRALILRGRVYVTSGNAVQAIDGATGAALWSTEAEDWLNPSMLMTDGHHILVAFEALSSTAESVLVAYEPLGGREAFRVHYPEGVTALIPVERHLVGLDEAAVEYVLLD